MNKNNNRVEAFGAHSLSWLDKVIYYFRVKSLKKYIKCTDKSVLDVGCGYNAVFLRYIKDTYNPSKVIAYDLSLNKSFLEKEGVVCVEGDLNEPFKNVEQVDVVFATAILEHLSNPVGFLHEIHSVLKPGGVLLLTTPSTRSKPVLEFLAYKLKLISRIEIEDHKEYFDKKKLIEYFTKAGFMQDNLHHEYFEIYMNNLVIAKK